MRPIPLKQVAQALRKSKGNHTVAAKMLGLTQQAVSLRVKKNAVLQDICEEGLTVRIQTAESKLDEAVERGDAWAVCFTLKCLAGYREPIHVKADVAAGLVVKIVRFGEDDDSNAA